VVDKKIAVARLSVVSNTLLTIVKLIVGLAMGSVSVLSEAVHSGLDLLAAVIAYLSVRKSSQPADERHRFGHGKYENVASIIEAILIIGAATVIIFQAIPKFFQPHTVHALGLGTAVMGFSAVVNFWVSHILFKVAKETDSPALAGDAWHLRTDVYTSLGVFAGLGLIKLTGLTVLDPAIAIIIAGLILRAAYNLIKESMKGLLDVRLPDEEERVIREALAEYQDEYLEFHELRTRKSGPYRFVDLHLVAPSNRPLAEVHSLCDRIEQTIEARLPRSQVMIHIEPCDERCDLCRKCDADPQQGKR